MVLDLAALRGSGGLRHEELQARLAPPDGEPPRAGECPPTPGSSPAATRSAAETSSPGDTAPCRGATAGACLRRLQLVGRIWPIAHHCSVEVATRPLYHGPARGSRVEPRGRWSTWEAAAAALLRGSRLAGRAELQGSKPKPFSRVHVTADAARLYSLRSLRTGPDAVLPDPGGVRRPDPAVDPGRGPLPARGRHRTHLLSLFGGE